MQVPFVVVLCVMVVVVYSAQDNASDKTPGDATVRQCVDNDALSRECFAAIESAIKISQYGLQREKLKALRRLEKHVASMEPIIMANIATEPQVFANCLEIQESGITTSGTYSITPADSAPIDVYCDMDTDGGGWTVFQRRQDGTENFDRNSEDYAQGFGSPDGEFWLGNEALLAMTSAGGLDLRVDLWDWDSAYRYATYTGFTVAGDNYVMSFDGESYNGNAGDSLSFHNGWGFTTRDHDVDGATGGNCAEWLYSGWWFNYCHRANLNGHYKNRLDAVDGQRDQGIQWWAWHGENYSLMKSEMKLRPVMKAPDSAVMANCAEIYESSGDSHSGVYTIAPLGMEPMEVYCDMDTDGGGWTVFQKRSNGDISFDTTFEEFAQGFGEASGDYWLGNYALRNMTDPKFGSFELRVDISDWDDALKYAKYSDFSVTGDDFTLNIGQYSGNAGDSLTFHNGWGFTTRDHDVDGATGGNCAEWLYSGWWFNYCHRANLNGHYKNRLDAVDGQEDQGIQWVAWKGKNYSLQSTQMKFRPVA